MKKLVCLLISAVTVLAFVAGACAPEEVEKVTIKMNTSLDPPVREDMGQNPEAWTLEWFCDTVNERTQGQVEFEIYWLSELGVEGTEDLRAVRDGLLDVTASPDGYIAGDIPELMGAGQPLLISASEYPEIASKINPILDKVLTEKWGVVPIGYWPIEEQILNSIEPMDSIDDFAGIKLRGWNPGHMELAKSLGASPVSISMAELYVAYQRGIADAIITGLGTYLNLKLYEVGKYFNTIPINSGLLFVYFNEDAFSSLPKNTQEIILEVAQEATQFHTDTALAGYYRIYDRAITDFGMTNVDFPPEELEKIRAKAPFIWEEWADSNGPIAQEILQIIRETFDR